MKGKHYFKITAIMSVLLLSSNILSRPSYFWYKTYGVHDYGESNSNLDIEEDYEKLNQAIYQIPSWTWGLYPNGCYYDDALTTNTLEDESFNSYEFVLLHIHGGPGGITLPPGNGGEADMNDIGWGGGDLGGGAPPWGNGYLKWLWAHSCKWFDIGYWLPAEDWTYDFFGNSEWWNDFNNTSQNIGGVSCDNHYEMLDCDNGDWFKSRIKNFEGHQAPSAPISGKLHDYDEVSLWCNCLNTGKIDVYLGGPDDNNPRVRIEEGRLHLGTITFTSSDVGSDERRWIRNISIPHNTESYCYYLEFRDGEDICEISNIRFYANDNPQTWSLTEEGVPLMQERVLTWRNVFHGIHTILGWGSITYGSRDRKIFDDFFDNWVWFDYPIYESYFGAVQDELNGPSAGQIPAIACAAGQGGKPWYHYFLETWDSATDELAQPTERCVIMWDIPDFGLWWEPQ